MTGTQKQRYSVKQMMFGWVIWDHEVNERVDSKATRKEARAECAALNRNDNRCSCGSKQPRYPLKDGYGIFMCYVCDECVKEKRAQFRGDIFERYETDEQIEPD